MADVISIERLLSLSEAAVDAISVITVDCVEGGASVNFMLPFTLARALYSPHRSL